MAGYSGDCTITPYTAQAIASKDSNRLLGSIAKALAINSPFVNILDGGVLPAGISDTVVSTVQEQSLSGDSLVNPTFATTSTTSGPGTVEEQVATKQYSYTLGTKRGRGPKINVKGSYAAYKGSYLMAEDSMRKLMQQYINADVRYALLDQSGHKYVALNSGTNSFADGLTGGEMQGGASGAVAWSTVTSANIGPITFKALHKLARYLKEVTLAEQFLEGTAQQHFKFIGGSDVVEGFRNEAGITANLQYITAGSFKYGEESLRSYSWESNVAYRGITFGIDQRPLRASAVSAGSATFVEPFVSVATTKGNASRVNPAWVAAAFEVGFLIAKGSFERLVPERYTGEGSFKFSPQLAMGELQWHYVIDNDCNQYGDFGWHLYEITRAYRPVRPHFVVPVLYRRCNFDTGITACAATGSLL